MLRRQFYVSVGIALSRWPGGSLLAMDQPSEGESFTPGEEFQAWVTELVREQLPAEYVKKKNWGHTTKTFDGVSVQLDDFQLKTHRKYRQANDGKWQMVRVRLKNPAERFAVRVARLRPSSEGHVALDLRVVADLAIESRQALWEHGIQIFSLGIEADAKVRLTAELDIATTLQPFQFPPGVRLDPVVTAAKLDIPEFRLRRIGELDGPLVRALSHTTREAIEEKIADDNAKLVASLNKQIAKQKSKLVLSATEWNWLRR